MGIDININEQLREHFKEYLNLEHVKSLKNINIIDYECNHTYDCLNKSIELTIYIFNSGQLYLRPDYKQRQYFYIMEIKKNKQEKYEATISTQRKIGLNELKELQSLHHMASDLISSILLN